MLILNDEEVREEISSALANIQQPVQGRIFRVGSLELWFGTVPYLLIGYLLKAGQGTIFFHLRTGFLVRTCQRDVITVTERLSRSTKILQKLGFSATVKFCEKTYINTYISTF
jgi:hypothetical protein